MLLVSSKQKLLHFFAFLSGTRNFFNNQTRHRHPACITTRVSISRTVADVDSNANFSLVNVVTVAFYCSMSVVAVSTTTDPQCCVNRHWTAAFGAIKGNKPSLTAVAATTQADVALKNNAKSCVVLVFSKLAILQQQKQHEKQ